MDGIVPILIGLVLLIGILTFIVSIVLVWISYRRTFKSDKAFMISMVNVVFAAIACVFGFFLINTVAGYDVLIFTGIMMLISMLIAIRISKRTETKWVE